MKVFISWSGRLSSCVARILSDRLPSIINSLEIFYSTDDIQKGENWDARITEELSKCNFGIICLTSENVLSPWINFEAGAISNTLNSKTTAFLIDIEPSNIKGPLTRFQATRFDKEDFRKMILSLNNNSEAPLTTELLYKNFDLVWNTIEEEIQSKVIEYNRIPSEKAARNVGDDAIEEILHHLRNMQNEEMIKNESHYCDSEILDALRELKNMINKNESDMTEKSKRVLSRIPESELEQVYEDAFHLVRSEISSLYELLTEESSKAAIPINYIHLHEDTVRGLEKRLLCIKTVLHGEAVDISEDKLEGCKILLKAIKLKRKEQISKQ